VNAHMMGAALFAAVFATVFATVFALARPSLAAADTPAPISGAEARPAPKRGALTIQMENDRFPNTDRHYTHGSRIA
jgi:hypothetical protein